MKNVNPPNSMGKQLPPLRRTNSVKSAGPMGVNYKKEWKEQKVKISELETQVTTMKWRMETLRKAKNQTILKNTTVHRDILAPQFNNHGTNGVTVETDSAHDMTSAKPCLDLNKYVEEVKPVITTAEIGVNTDKPLPVPKAETPTKRRIRTRENWAQCKIFTDNKTCQVDLVQRCQCEGLPLARAISAAPPPSTSTLPDIKRKPSLEPPAAVKTPVPSFRTISRQSTNEYMSIKQHNQDVNQIKSTYKSEMEKLKVGRDKEIGMYKQTIDALNKGLKELTEKSVKTTIKSDNGSSLFHMYAEEKGKLEKDIKGFSNENTKLRKQIVQLKRDIREKEDEWEENEEAIKDHYAASWDEQYRAWMSKTDSKLNNLRDANRELQEFIQKYSKQLKNVAIEGLTVKDEYGEPMPVLDSLHR